MGEIVMKKFKKLGLVLSAILVTASLQACGLVDTEEKNVAAAAETKTKPKNVIMLIGDGMGIGQVGLAGVLENGKDGRLFMESLPNVALMHTSSANNIVTDSAAAGTALATGVKTNNGMIGVNPEGVPVDSLLDKFKNSGKKVGVVTNHPLTDATPGAFVGSTADRWTGNEDLARQILDNKVDVALGGGGKYFKPEKQNGVNLVDSFKEEGYTFVSNKEELKNASGDKLLGLFNESYMNYVIDRDDISSQEPSLTEMFNGAINVLNKGKKGFFLMLEGGRIDHAAHGSDATGIWRETIEFDNAVKTAVEWAKKDGNTLVVVVADHETNGISVTESMKTEEIKGISVSPEFMAKKLVKDPSTNSYTSGSVISVFKEYAGIDLTENEVSTFLSKIKDQSGTIYPENVVSWIMGSMIAEYNKVGVVSLDVVLSSPTTAGHTANMIPVFAYGPSSEKFEGVLENIDIPKIITEISKIKN